MSKSPSAADDCPAQAIASDPAVVQGSGAPEPDRTARLLEVLRHEIRTSLNATIGIATLLRDGDLSTEQKLRLDTQQEAAQAALYLFEEALGAAQPSSKRLPDPPERFELRLVVQKVVDLLRGEADLRGLKLTAQIDPTLPTVALGDPGRLGYILTRLASNAIKFTDAGSVELLVYPLEQTEDGLRVGIDVRDTGVGVPPDQQPTLIQGLARMSGALPQSPAGTGLTLALCQLFASRLGGTLSMTGLQDGGTCFHLALPITAAPTKQQAGPRKACKAAGRPLRILLVEDNAVNRAVAEAMLSRSGFDVSAVDNGAKAVAAVESSAFDLVLMDLRMPVMGGLEATRAIRALAGPARTVPIVALTADVCPAVKKACQAAGMDGFVAKPIVLQDLLGAISRAVCGHSTSSGDAGSLPPSLLEAA